MNQKIKNLIIRGSELEAVADEKIYHSMLNSNTAGAWSRLPKVSHQYLY